MLTGIQSRYRLVSLKPGTSGPHADVVILATWVQVPPQAAGNLLTITKWQKITHNGQIIKSMLWRCLRGALGGSVGRAGHQSWLPLKIKFACPTNGLGSSKRPLNSLPVPWTATFGLWTLQSSEVNCCWCQNHKDQHNSWPTQV